MVLAVHHEQRTLRVAVLEDSAVEQRIIERALSPADVTKQATSLDAARAWLAEDRVDVILLDRQLPDGDGWSIAAQLRDAHPGIQVFVYTGTEAPLMRPAGVHWLDKRRMHEWRDTIARLTARA